jgi:hypothetical protein
MVSSHLKAFNRRTPSSDCGSRRVDAAAESWGAFLRGRNRSKAGLCQCRRRGRHVAKAWRNATSPRQVWLSACRRWWCRANQACCRWRACCVAAEPGSAAARIRNHPGAQPEHAPGRQGFNEPFAIGMPARSSLKPGLVMSYFAGRPGRLNPRNLCRRVSALPALSRRWSKLLCRQTPTWWVSVL